MIFDRPLLENYRFRAVCGLVVGFGVYKILMHRKKTGSNPRDRFLFEKEIEDRFYHKVALYRGQRQRKQDALYWAKYHPRRAGEFDLTQMDGAVKSHEYLKTGPLAVKPRYVSRLNPTP